MASRFTTGAPRRSESLMERVDFPDLGSPTIATSSLLMPYLFQNT